MALNRNIKVKLPESKCSFSQPNKNGEVYVYYLLSSKRKPEGGVYHKRINIGIRDENPTLLIPNNNYYEVFKESSLTLFAPQSIRNYGNYYLLYNLAKESGLWETIKEVFGSDSEKYLTITMYMLCEQSAMYYLDDYCDENYIINNTYVTSQETTNLFKKITLEHKQKFFSSWVKQIKKNECIAYDITSISSYARELSDVDYGYNRDKESLPQINIGMFYAQESKLPLFYDVYNGSIGDKVHFEAMMKYAKSYGFKNITLVMDRGFYKRDNLKYLYDNNIPFIMGISNSLTQVSKEIITNRYEITKSKYELDYDSTNGISESINIDNMNYKLHLFYNYQKTSDEEKILRDKINKLENELKNLQRIPDDNRYKKYFDITINEDGEFTYKRNNDRIDDEKIKIGFYSLLSSRCDHNINEILKIYRTKDTIEKTFDNMKNFIDNNRLRVHTNESLNGKMFITFISLILKSMIDNVLSTNLKKENLTTKKLINELSKIKITRLYNGEDYISPLNAKQKKYLDAFNLNEKELKESILQLQL